MNPSLLILTATLALSFLSPDTASARSLRPSNKPKHEPDKVNASGSQITMVSGDSITVEYSKKSTTYKMSNETRISIDGNRARSTDLKPGMRAEIDVSSINPSLLLSIQASSLAISKK